MGGGASFACVRAHTDCVAFVLQNETASAGDRPDGLPLSTEPSKEPFNPYLQEPAPSPASPGVDNLVLDVLRKCTSGKIKSMITEIRMNVSS